MSKNQEPQELFNMTVQEVSLVDKGANGRKFLLMKRDDSKTTIEEIEKFGESSVSLLINWKQKELDNDWWSLTNALQDTFRAISLVNDEAEKSILLNMAIEDFKSLVFNQWGLAKQISEKKEAIEKATDKDIEAQKIRAKKYGIEPKEGKPITMPKRYADLGLKDDDFSDPTNYAYPITEQFIRAARAYSAREGMREDGGYTEKEWKIILGRIDEAAKKFKIGEYAEKTEKQDDSVEKAGATLSAKTRQAIRTALESLQALIVSVDGADNQTEEKKREEPVNVEKSEEPDVLLQAITAMRKEMQPLIEQAELISLKKIIDQTIKETIDKQSSVSGIPRQEDIDAIVEKIYRR